jgi:hypothetical protein
MHIVGEMSLIMKSAQIQPATTQVHPFSSLRGTAPPAHYARTPGDPDFRMVYHGRAESPAGSNQHHHTQCHPRAPVATSVPVRHGAEKDKGCAAAELEGGAPISFHHRVSPSPIPSHVFLISRRTVGSRRLPRYYSKPEPRPQSSATVLRACLVREPCK